MKRGEIYFIKTHQTVGSEIAKGRPAVIVSNDALNTTSDVVEVVFLTTRPKKELPCHAVIYATGVPSTVLCEQVNSVSKVRVGDYFGECTEEEMHEIDAALMRSLRLNPPYTTSKKGQEISKGEQWLIEELGKLKAERDRYAKMVDYFLDGDA